MCLMILTMKTVLKALLSSSSALVHCACLLVTEGYWVPSLLIKDQRDV